MCCEPYLTGKKHPESPETLMRSRYTAYTQANIDYIKKTMRGKALMGFDELEARRWANRVHWIKLTVFASFMEDSTHAYVEFEASFIDDAYVKSLHENSNFSYEQGQWYYISGTLLPPTHAKKRISLNTTCPCGSLKKYKNCVVLQGLLSKEQG